MTTKSCPKCNEVVPVQFEFCPVDGTPLPNGHQPAGTDTPATADTPTLGHSAHARTAFTDTAANNNPALTDATTATMAAAQVPAANISSGDAPAAVPYDRG